MFMDPSTVDPLDFYGPWHREGPSRSLGPLNLRSKSEWWLPIMVSLISLPYLDWLGIDGQYCCSGHL